MLISNFPTGVSPRPAQIDLINKIEKAFEEYDIVICSAPTGTGKSFLSKTLANASKSPDEEFVDDITSYRAFRQDYEEVWSNQGAAVLTITKALQDQYTSLFDDCESLKGKGNYRCAVDPNCDVEIAPCLYLPKLKKECWSKNKCPYYEQRNRALSSKFSTYNYDMFFALPTNLKYKDYLICDEASEIEDQLVKHFTLNLTEKTLKFLDIKAKLPNVTNYNTFYKWLVDLNSLVSDLVVELKQLIGSNKKTEKDVTKFKALSRLNDKVKLIVNSWENCQYVLTKKKDSITVTPLYISSLSSEIFKYGKKILLMSATIIDPQNFAKTLGIEKYKFIESESPFNPERSPIFISSKYKLNYQNLQQNLPKVADLIQQICDEHHNTDKGVIHTHTSSITEFLKNRLKGDRFQYRYEEVNNEKLLQEHIAADFASVLVSPSITHGVDLKDDLARFQIIVKLPYMPLGDDRIKKLFEEDSNWYTNKMLSSLVQACGRGVRSQEDWCVTYILDGSAVSVVQRTKDKLPKFFLDRIQ
jgi:ATP-dependent DNA helicase DinG